MKDSFFNKIEGKTNVDKKDIINLAKSIQNEDLKDEVVLRKLIEDVAKLANKEVSPEKTEKIIDAIKKDKIKNFDKMVK